MADPVDRADQEIEVALAASLALRKPAGPRAVGHCLYCKCSLAAGLRWCDDGCHEDWENEQAALVRTGGSLS